ncbi:MAG: N-acetyltransferase [Prevotella sp.]|nr:N-acetyltransferase [Prevotella sp.]
MSNVDVLAVMTSKQMCEFIHVVDNIYHHCQQYVPDLESDIRALFSRKTNPGLEFSNIQPFIAYRDNIPVGRIVGIINRRSNKKWNVNSVRFAMLEFIDDPAVSEALLNAVEQWGKSFGMDVMQGPLGITDFDKEGMLVEDFHLPGSMNTIYNPEYYPRHMEALGFGKEVDWVQIHIRIPEEVPAKYARVAQYVKEQMGLRVIKLSNREINKNGYGKKVFNLLNDAYQPIFGFSELSDEQRDNFLNRYLKLIDKQLMPFIVNDKDDVVGAAITMGSLTQAMRKAKGRLWPFGWYYILKALRWKREDNAEMLLVAVRPDYQGLGVNALFFDDLIPIYNKYGFKWAETGPQLEDNVRELTQWKPLKPQYVKRRRCYKKNI